MTPLLHQSDIARLLGVSRERVRQLRQQHADFPEPTDRTSRSLLWRLEERWAESFELGDEALRPALGVCDGRVGGPLKVPPGIPAKSLDSGSVWAGSRGTNLESPAALR